jgi:surface antigen
MKKIILSVSGVLLAVASLNTAVVAAEKKCGSGLGGAAIGGAMGGLLGNKLSKDKTVGTVVGALGGAIVGSIIAKQLDQCEKEKMAEATVSAVNAPTGKAQAWKSDSRDDVHGTVTAAAPEKLADGRQCRTVTNVAYISGKEVRETPRLCRTPPASDWKVA